MKVLIMSKSRTDLREKFAAQTHASWSGWMEHLFRFGQLLNTGQFAIDADKVERWKRQMQTPYAELTDAEQASDRTEADHYLKLMAGCD